MIKSLHAPCYVFSKPLNSIMKPVSVPVSKVPTLLPFENVLPLFSSAKVIKVGSGQIAV